MKKEIRDKLRKELSSIFYDYFNYEFHKILEEYCIESKQSRDKRQLAKDFLDVIKNEMIRRNTFKFDLNPLVDLKVTILNDVGGTQAKFIPASSTILINTYPNLNDEFKARDISKILSKLEIVLYHEVIHYLDYKYMVSDPHHSEYKEIKPDNPDYYKSEMESEAYFQSIAYIFEAVNDKNKTIEDFYNSFGNNISDFSNVFWKTAENYISEKGIEQYRKFRMFIWSKKIYKLYFELKSKFDQEAEKMLEAHNKLI